MSDDNESMIKPKAGLKINNSKSIMNNIPKKPNPVEIEAKAREAIDRSEGYNSEVANLVSMFKKTLEDKTLADNKSSLSLDAEKELIGKMIDLAININNDPNQREGMGSVGLIIVLLKSILDHRDKVNKLSYDMLQSDRKINSLQEKIKLLSVDKDAKNE